MSDYFAKPKKTISLNCNLENNFKDLLVSMLYSHSKLDYKINQLLNELESIMIFDSDETIFRYENILIEIHQILDRKTSNCDRMSEYLHNSSSRKEQPTIETRSKEESIESNISSSNEIAAAVVEKEQQKVINSPSNQHKKQQQLTKRDKSRRSLRIITQSKCKYKHHKNQLLHGTAATSNHRQQRGAFIDHSNSNNDGNTGTANNNGKRNNNNNNNNSYCYCKKGAFGKMIACDNSSCKIEWFHNKCVNVIDVPNGEWFCPECRAG